MLIKHPCQYSSWQELVEDHAEIPYRFALGFPVEHKFDVFPYLFEATGQFSFSKLVPIPNTITDWDKQYYPTNWFLENWGSLNDAFEFEVPQEDANDPYATIVFTCIGFNKVNGHNQNLFFCYPNRLRNFPFSRIFRHFKALIDLASF